MTGVLCPCCQGGDGLSGASAEQECRICGHRWRPAPAATHYAALQGRNAASAGDLERKIADRLASIRPLLRDKLRILEVGCAEGQLGVRVKQLAQVTYVGLEISADASAAAAHLDQVLTTTTAHCQEAPFDLILAFHVLEHIDDIRAEVTHWKRLLKPDGRLLAETPNRAGHPLLERDANPEHAHQFTPASLTLLIQQAGLQVQQLSDGHFESPVYSDSLRLLAAPAVDASTRVRLLQQRFLARLGKRFVVYGIGGDFRNYIEPLLPLLPIAALCDAHPELHGHGIGGHTVTSYDRQRLGGLPILIASTRHQQDIGAHLQSLGVDANAIVGLDAIFGT